MSIDDLERVALGYGLPAAQEVVPPEFLVTPAASSLPAIALLAAPDVPSEEMPSASCARHDQLTLTLLWRVEAGRVQILDIDGRRAWIPCDALLERLPPYDLVMAADRFNAFARLPRFVDALRAQLADMGVSVEKQQQLIDRALEGEGWKPLAALDGATRAARVHAAPDAASFIEWAAACAFRGDAIDPLDPVHYCARPAPPTDDGVEQVVLRGAVAVVFHFAPKVLPRAVR